MWGLTSSRCCSATVMRIWDEAANLLLSAALGALARTVVRMLHMAAQTCASALVRLQLQSKLTLKSAQALVLPMPIIGGVQCSYLG